MSVVVFPPPHFFQYVHTAYTFYSNTIAVPSVATRSPSITAATAHRPRLWMRLVPDFILAPTYLLYPSSVLPVLLVVSICPPACLAILLLSLMVSYTVPGISTRCQDLECCLAIDVKLNDCVY